MNKRLKLLHVTDLHLDYSTKFEYDSFLSKVKARDFDCMVVSGDTCDGAYTDRHIAKLHKDIGKKPIYFVLGNHDYYNTSVEYAQTKAAGVTVGTYLTMSKPIQLHKDVVIVGDDGFYDGVHGEGARTTVQLLDFKRISDFYGKNKFDVMFDITQKSSKRLRPKLELAAEMAKTILVATHVPPFPEASRYNGKQAGADFLPFYSSKTMGDMFAEFAAEHPDNDIFVLCGHTHHPAVVTIKPNLVVFVGQAHIGGQLYYREMMI